MRRFISFIICLINIHSLSSIFSWLSEEYGKAQQLAEAIASGEKLDRKVYRIRNKEVRI